MYLFGATLEGHNGPRRRSYTIVPPLDFKKTSWSGAEILLYSGKHSTDIVPKRFLIPQDQVHALQVIYFLMAPSVYIH